MVICPRCGSKNNGKLIYLAKGKTEREVLKAKDKFLRFGNWRGRYITSSPIVQKGKEFVAYLYFLTNLSIRK